MLFQFHIEVFIVLPLSSLLFPVQQPGIVPALVRHSAYDAFY